MELKYRPPNKSTYSNPGVFSRFIKQFMDPFDYATDKGRYRRGYDRINEVLATHSGKQRHSIECPLFAIKNHLNANEPSRMLYYCNRPDRDIHLVCFDIDSTATTTPEDIDKIRILLQSIFPDSYYDCGSSGNSLHYYILIDTSIIRNSIFLDTKSSAASIINTILYSIIEFIKPTIEQNYNIILCGIKGNVSDYTFSSGKNNKKYFSKINSTSNKAICKLPLPKTIEQFELLYKTPIVRFHQLILDLSQYELFIKILNTNLNKQCNVEDLLNDLIKYYNENNKNINLLLLLGEPTQWSVAVATDYISAEEGRKQEQEGKSFQLNKPLSLIHNIIGAHFANVDYLDKIEDNKNKNLLSNTSNLDCAFRRSIKFGLEFTRNYYKINKIKPSCEEYRKEYRTHCGTGEELNDDRIRLEQVYNYIMEGFDKDKLGKTLQYKVGEFLSFINITEADINKINNNRYLRNITIQDIDVAAGFYFMSLTGLLEQKKFCDKELSVAQNNMGLFFKALKDKKLIPYSCNNHKAVVLKDILLDMGWLECVDTSYYTTSYKSGRARRYLLTDKFPRYLEFVSIVGQNIISKWEVNKEQVLKKII